MNLSKNTKVSIAITPTEGGAAATGLAGATLDMQGYEGVLMIVHFGAITGSAETAIKAQQDSTSDWSDAKDLKGTKQIVADSDDDKVFYLDLYRPEKRYVRLYVERATQNAVISSAVYVQYGARKKPAMHGTNVSGGVNISPDEGTA